MGHVAFLLWSSASQLVGGRIACNAERVNANMR